MRCVRSVKVNCECQVNVNLLGRTFRKQRKRVGPRIVPWKTDISIGTVFVLAERVGTNDFYLLSSVGEIAGEPL